MTDQLTNPSTNRSTRQPSGAPDAGRLPPSHDSVAPNAPDVRRPGLVDYEDTVRAMREYTTARTSASPDRIWLLEHPPVYTLGQAGRPEHLRDAGGIPVARTDRGGQVTYHGPGQLIVYLMLDLPRLGVGVRGLVRAMEDAVCALLRDHGLAGARREGAPGVYVDGRKVCALGLRVRRGCSYHGLALNVDMDLAPFDRIDPCGYPGLAVTRLADLGVEASVEATADVLLPHLVSRLYERDPD